MAGLIFEGLKLGFKAIKAYKAKINEFKELEEDAEELLERVEMLEPSVLRLETNGGLDDDLMVPLTLTSKQLKKTQVYIDQVHAFCEQHHKAGNLKTIAACLASSTIRAVNPEEFVGLSLPGLTEKNMQAASDMFFKLGGPPAKKFDELADKLKARVDALTLACTVQVTQNTMSGGSSGKISRVQVAPAPDQQTMGGSAGGTLPLSKSQELGFADRMGKLLQEDAEEEAASGKAVSAYRIRHSSVQGVDVWGVVYKGRPYMLITTNQRFAACCPMADEGPRHVVWLLLPSMGELYSPRLKKIGCGVMINSLDKDIQAYMDEQKFENPQYYQECMQKLQLPIKLTEKGPCCMGLACGLVPLEAPGSIYNESRKTRECLHIWCWPCHADSFYVLCRSSEQKALKAVLGTQSGYMEFVLHMDSHIQIDGVPFYI